jgi:hypothetical protein
VGCGRGLGGGSGLGREGDMMDGQGMAWDATFRDSGQGCGWGGDLARQGLGRKGLAGRG